MLVKLEKNGMVVHVGISAYEGNVRYYNDVSKETKDFKIDLVNQNDINKIDTMYMQIKQRIGGAFGCVCIYLLENYNNEIRKKFIDSGMHFGFLKVAFIDWSTLLYMNLASRAQFIPKENDIIWILWSTRCYIWEKTNTKVKMIKAFLNVSLTTEDKLKRTKMDSGLNRNPDKLFVTKSSKVDIIIAKKIFPSCSCILFSDNWNKVGGAMIKAQIMANDLHFLTFDTFMYLKRFVFIKINGKDVITFDEYEPLPIERSAIYNLENSESVLIISSENAFCESIQLTPSMLSTRKCLITVIADENKIFVVKCSEVLMQPLHPPIPMQPIERHVENIHLNPNTKKIVENKNSYSIPKKLTSFDENIYALGIDLGTSRCCAAVSRRNGIETVALENTGERLLPSYVSFSEEKEKCGQIVVNQLQHYSKSTIFDSKRIIGRSFHEVNISESWPFEIINKVGEPILRVQGPNKILEKQPEEIAAILLKHIKQKVEEFQGKKLTEVVITVPAAFSDNQKSATSVAGLLAGWENIHLLPEPVAASMAYFVDRPIPNNFTMLLFDFGGGTLDVCVFNVTNDTLSIISKAGNNNLGGRDCDNILFNHFSLILKNQYLTEVSQNPKLKYRLIQKCMEIKHVLTIQTEARFDVNDFNANIEDSIAITRQGFEAMSSTILNQIREVIINALSIANYTSRDINKILLAGGSSRMPMVKQLLASMFSNAEHCCEENPDEVVAIGAAYYAYYLNSQKGVSRLTNNYANSSENNKFAHSTRF